MNGIETLPVEEESALQLAKLPALHSDPFDRMLVCQALVHGLILLTPDEAIARYPCASFGKVCGDPPVHSRRTCLMKRSGSGTSIKTGGPPVFGGSRTSRVPVAR